MGSKKVAAGERALGRGVTGTLVAEVRVSRVEQG